MTDILDRSLPREESEPALPLEEAAPAPHRKRWTRKECDFLAQNGILTDRYELINGDIVEKMSQNPPHMITVMLFTAWLMRVFGMDHVFCQGTLDVDMPDAQTNAPESDVMALNQSVTAFSSHLPLPADIVLLVEVSDSTLRFDLQGKALLYARAGVEDYWVADVIGRRIITHRNPTTTGYTEVVEYSAEMQLAPIARPEALARVSDLLAPERPVETAE